MAVAAIAGTLPAAASASTVSVDPDTAIAVFRSGPQVSDVTSLASTFAPWLPFSDGAQTLDAGAGCVAGTPVLCDGRDADIQLEGGDDRYRGWSWYAIRVSGGSGDDEIAASGAYTVVSGDGGADTITVGSNGTARADGGSGDDRIRSTTGVYAFLNGGDGSDLIAGDRPFNTLSGGRGDDDVFVLGVESTVSGGPGRDTIVAYARPWGARRTLDGDGDDDTIVGAAGPDTVSGGGGDDVIDVSGDADVDTVSCGSGTDIVYADAADAVAADCEVRAAGPMPPSAAVDAARARYRAAFGVLPS